MSNLSMFRKLSAAIAICTAAFFFYVYYIRYFKWRDCFNELGRCYDSDTSTVYVEQSGMIWMMLGILSFGITIWILRPRRR